MARSCASRRVGKKGGRATGVVRIEPAGMAEVSGVGWPLTAGLRRVDIVGFATRDAGILTAQGVVLMSYGEPIVAIGYQR